ncbi:MAG TPA: hypothetical protein VFP50_15235 [Anaeromyxobacteraceae bacterium]|nr:hypothetical protein [Anaeromyxobacteraceae bacterium]
MPDLFTSEVPAWDRGPRCPEKDCGGAAVPVYEHHLFLGKNAPRPGEHALPASHNLACATCGKTWRGRRDEEERAAEAHYAWEMNHRGAGSHRRSEWEARKLADEAAKVARLKEGRW